MIVRKSALVMALAVIASCSLGGSAAKADTITFENAPDANLYYGGNTNVGNLYSGVTFGPGVTILDSTRFAGYNSGSYPAHSGTAVAFSVSDPTFTFTFATPQSGVSFWYTEGNGAGTAVASLLGGGTETINMVNALGTDTQAVFAGTNITGVTITAPAGYYTIDDVHFNGTSGAVPEPGQTATLAMGVLGLLGLTVFARRRKSAV